jgi:dTDP-4-dehydrorhamnose 3,5-epimerase
MILSWRHKINLEMINSSNILDGMRLFSYPTIHKDNRGNYKEIFNSNLLSDIEFDVKQVSIVKPKKNSLRGFHGDSGTAKFVSVLSGNFFIAVVDPREGSPTYGKSFMAEISSQDQLGIYLPPGLGNGFLSMTNDDQYLYLQNTLYGDFKQFTINYSDPFFKVKWPKRKFIISERDMNAKTLKYELSD